MFKKGDVVVYRATGDVGIVDAPVDNMPGEVWVNWTDGADAGQRLHCSIDSITLLTPACSASITKYSVADLKKLLDKMDDNIVFSFSDLKIK